MSGIARLGDRTQGTCVYDGPQGGTITSASGNFFVDGKQVARDGDEVTADCGHVDYINSGSADTFADNKKIARLGDSVGSNNIYVATITTASSTTNADS